MPRQTFGTAPAPLSPAVRAGDFVMISGQVPMLPDGRLIGGPLETQMDQTMANLKAALALAGATLDDVIKTTVWLTEGADFATFNRLYAGYFPDPAPARSTVRGVLMLDALLEIEAIAFAPLPPEAG